MILLCHQFAKPPWDWFDGGSLGSEANLELMYGRLSEFYSRGELVVIIAGVAQILELLLHGFVQLDTSVSLALRKLGTRLFDLL